MLQSADSDEAFAPAREEQPIPQENKENYIHILERQLDLDVLIPFYEGKENVILRKDDIPESASDLHGRFDKETAKLEERTEIASEKGKQKRKTALRDLFAVLASLGNSGEVDKEIDKVLEEIEDEETRILLETEIRRIMRLPRESQLPELPFLSAKLTRAEIAQIRIDGERNISKLFNPFRVNKLVKPFVIGKMLLTNPFEVEKMKNILGAENYEALLSFIRNGMEHFEDIKGVRPVTVNGIQISNQLARVVIELLNCSIKDFGSSEVEGVDLKEVVNELKGAEFGVR